MANPLDDVEIDALAVISVGLVGETFKVTEGLGLITFGFLWPVNGIWAECAACGDVSTTWTEVNR